MRAQTSTASWTYSAHQRDQIRVQLSNTIEAVVAQRLLPRAGGGRCAAIEIMIATSAIRNLIREGKTHQVYSALETGAQYEYRLWTRCWPRCAGPAR